MSVKFFNGIPVSQPNTIREINPEFYVSYNPSSADYGTDTTALVIRETSQFLVLAGNHSKEFKGLPFREALAYFYANVSKAVEQSEHGRVFKFVDGKPAYVPGGY